jgi:hypothetical protein
MVLMGVFVLTKRDMRAARSNYKYVSFLQTMRSLVRKFQIREVFAVVQKLTISRNYTEEVLSAKACHYSKVARKRIQLSDELPK